jgi:hypothetical protein
MLNREELKQEEEVKKKGLNDEALKRQKKMKYLKIKN